MVFQSYALYPHMTVAENMAFGLKLARVPQGRDRRGACTGPRPSCRSSRCWSASPRPSPAASASAWPSAGPSSASPSVFLFDEPLSNLDAALRVQMRVELSRLHERAQDHHGLRDPRPGGGHDAGRPHRRDQPGPASSRWARPWSSTTIPANQFVAGFIGSPKMNFLDCRLVSAEDGTALVRLTDGTALP